MTRFLSLLISLFIFISQLTFASEKSICGAHDDRVPSSDEKIGRAVDKLTSNGGCTITMISDRCGISAGHCEKVLVYGEFNVPDSTPDGRAQHPGEKDIYEVDRKTLESDLSGSNDWSVFSFYPNKSTGLFPGEAQGHYEVSFVPPVIGEEIRITGFGTDEREKNVTQQTHAGKIVAFSWNSSAFEHSVDTMPGNSGSSVISEKTEKIIAVHTNGGCYERGGANAGYLTSQNPAFQKAIEKCLKRR